jgi:hypothetical protein
MRLLLLLAVLVLDQPLLLHVLVLGLSVLMSCCHRQLLLMHLLLPILLSILLLLSSYFYGALGRHLPLVITSISSTLCWFIHAGYRPCHMLQLSSQIRHRTDKDIHTS